MSVIQAIVNRPLEEFLNFKKTIGINSTTNIESEKNRGQLLIQYFVSTEKMGLSLLPRDEYCVPHPLTYHVQRIPVGMNFTSELCS